jgi:hypothetical protein
MKYVAASTVTAGVGQLVRLAAAQLARCEGLVKPAAEPAGWHEVVAPLQFKRGEAFEIDAELPKSMADLVESTKSPRARKARHAAVDPQAAGTSGDDAPLASAAVGELPTAEADQGDQA